MTFEFATAGRIVFGAGHRSEIAPAAAALGHCALLVTGTSPERYPDVVAALAQAQVATIPFHVPGEPTIELAQEGARLARTAGCDLVVGIGGGSVIDGAKAISALMTNRGDPLEYLEVIGQGRPLGEAPAPFIAVPTTAGTGAEVTRNAVLGSVEHGVKVSLRSPLMLPRLAVVDPELTWTMPPAVTAATGLDALTQLIEPYVSVRANPMTDGFCREGIPRVARSLERAFLNGDDHDAREDMALAGLLGGLALANAGLGAVHGFAAPIGGRFKAPHGAVCARLLPIVMEVNVRALRKRAPSSPALDRYDEIGAWLTGHPGALQAVTRVTHLGERFEIPGLGAYGITTADIPDLVTRSRAASSMKGNPIELTEEELEEILARAL